MISFCLGNRERTSEVGPVRLDRVVRELAERQLIRDLFRVRSHCAKVRARNTPTEPTPAKPPMCTPSCGRSRTNQEAAGLPSAIYSPPALALQISWPCFFLQGRVQAKRAMCTPSSPAPKKRGPYPSFSSASRSGEKRATEAIAKRQCKMDVPRCRASTRRVIGGFVPDERSFKSGTASIAAT